MSNLEAFQRAIDSSRLPDDVKGKLHADKAYFDLVHAACALAEALQDIGKADEGAAILISIGKAVWGEAATVAAAAGLRADPREKDDDAALFELARLLLRGMKLKPASRQVVPLADRGASEDATAHRIRQKFRERPLFWLETTELWDWMRAGAQKPSPMRYIKVYGQFRGWGRQNPAR